MFYGVVSLVYVLLCANNMTTNGSSMQDISSSERIVYKPCSIDNSIKSSKMGLIPIAVD